MPDMGVDVDKDNWCPEILCELNDTALCSDGRVSRRLIDYEYTERMALVMALLHGFEQPYTRQLR